MGEDPRRLEGGKWLLDLSKYVLTGVALSSLLSERVNLPVGLLGLSVGGLLALGGFLTLPPKKPGEKEEMK